MYAIITTDEYKELLKAKEENENHLDDICELVKRVLDAEESLKELLLILTNGKTDPSYYNIFEWYEIPDRNIIVDYINNNYVVDGKLQFRKVEKVEKEENTDE